MCRLSLVIDVDNSDSPSIVEQSQQGTGYSCIPLLFLVTSSVECTMPYAFLPSLLQCCLELFLGTACPLVLCLIQLSLSEDLGFCRLFYPVHICTALWDSLSGLCALRDSLSSFPGPWLGSCILGWPVWPVIGYPLLGVHPSMSIVRLVMIGYHCNCLDGQLNYWASAHWLIGGTTMYWLCIWWLCHITLLQQPENGKWLAIRLKMVPQELKMYNIHVTYVIDM